MRTRPCTPKLSTTRFLRLWSLVGRYHVHRLLRHSETPASIYIQFLLNNFNSHLELDQMPGTCRSSSLFEILIHPITIIISISINSQKRTHFRGNRPDRPLPPTISPRLTSFHACRRIRSQRDITQRHNDRQR